MRNLLIVAVFGSFLTTTWAADTSEPPTVEGRVTDVTVYQGQALVARTVDLPDQQGLVEVVVTSLPEFVAPASLYAEPLGEGVEIRSVRYRVRPMEQDVRAEVRELDAELKALAEERDAVQRTLQLLGERKTYLTKLEDFTTGTAKTELTSGVLNAETLKSLTEFVFAEREKVSTQELELTRDTQRIDAELEIRNRRRGEISSGSARTVREAIVFANVKQAGGARFRLNYLVSNATWSPSYNLRAGADHEVVRVEYNAAVEQRSGEDWNDVNMTLSTATPSLVANAPSLDPLVIKLQRLENMPQIAQATSGVAEYDKFQKELSERRKLLADNRGNFGGMGGGLGDQVNAPATAAPAEAAGVAGQVEGAQMFAYSDAVRSSEVADRGLNEIANQLQVLDYNSARIETKKEEGPGPIAGEGVSVSYALANRMSLPSRSDRQLIQISTRELRGDFYRLAIPVLTGYVYEEAELVNDADDVLLAGPSSTFLAGQFVGRGDVPTVAVGESFKVGLGIDTSLRVTRKLSDKSERIQGGNRVVDFTYDLAIENFGSEPAKVRLMDRMPTAGQSDINLTLVKSDEPVCDDPEYQLDGLKQGLLRWDVEVPAKATGPDRYTLSYTIQIEYDKQLVIEGTPASVPQP